MDHFFVYITPSIVQKLTSELNLWYIDDGTVDGKQPDLLHDIEVINSEDLKLNASKCQVVSTDTVLASEFAFSCSRPN